MGRWQPFPLPDGRYSDDVRPWSQQDVCNYLPTPAEGGGTRSPILFKPVPGLHPFAVVGDGPHRGARDVEGKLFVVSGRTLYQLAPNGTATNRGTIPGTGRVSMTHNQVAGGNQLVIGTGDNSYVWDTVANTLTATGIGLQSVDFVGQLILGVTPDRRFWRYSGLADATGWSSLDVESAESSPDRLVGGIVSQSEWLAFGERTIEVFPNSPTDTTAFQRATVIERGCANAATLCRLDNSVFFVDNNGIPCRLQGYQPVPIAPKAIVSEIAQCDPRKLFAYTWEDRGYVVYYVTAQDGRTWGFDVTCQRWHRRESFGLDRWRLNTLFKWNGEWYGGDYVSGLIYRLSWGYAFEGSAAMPRRLRTGALHNDGNRAFIHGLKLVAQTGGPPSSPGEPLLPLTLTGNVPDGLRYTAVSGRYSAAGGVPPYVSYAVSSGTFPAGVTLSSDGTYSGAFSTAGTYSWTVRVTDALGATADLADTAVVAPVLTLATGPKSGDPGGVGAYTTDGAAWTVNAAIVYGAPVYADNRWCVVGDSGLGGTKYADDLSGPWTASTTPAGAAAGCAKFANGIVAAGGGNNELWTSADNCVNFVQVVGWPNRGTTCLEFGNGLWIAGMSDDTSYGPYRYSTDNWATHARGGAGGGVDAVMCAKYVGGNWYFGGKVGSDTGTIRKSANGLTGFTTLVSDAPSRVVSMATDGAGKWVGVCYAGEIIYTGDDWATHSVSSTTVESGVGYDSTVVYDGAHFIVADNNGVSQAQTRRSVDGNAWDAGVLTGIDDNVSMATNWVPA